MFCQYCGTEIPNNIKFCPKCGKPTNSVYQPQAQHNQQHQPKNSKNGCLIAVAILAILFFLGIPLIGIGAAFALPAYAKYMAKQRFTNVFTTTDTVKKQVELCITSDKNIVIKSNNKIEAKSCNNNSNGSNWFIQPAKAYKNLYIEDITVSNGKITTTTTYTNGLKNSTIVLEPFEYEGTIKWQLNKEESTCDDFKLCDKIK